jgi:hypothetical protein
VPSRERVGRRIPSTAQRNQLAGTGSETSRTSRFCGDYQSAEAKFIRRGQHTATHRIQMPR